MIKIDCKQDCCGCASCVQRCPKHCITMKEDEEGFLYPVVDEAICVNCGLCEKVCPIINRIEKLAVMEVLAVKNRNKEERMASSSGGVFIALAKEIIRKGGVVFGAVFDENWEVKHTYAETLEGVLPMMGSKYLQSRIEDTFSQARKFLKEGREVLFTGSPCQIAGLHKFLGKDYPNLLSVDFLCHGVPSPKVWRRYLEELITRQGGGKNSVLFHPIVGRMTIRSISFRSKSRGWKKYSFALTLSEALADGDKNTVLLSRKHCEDPYMQVFLSNIILRPSCYRCRCKNGVSHSDLTIADFWGINQLMPDFDDDKGVGLVLVNTRKGKEIFNILDMDVRVSSLEDAERFNGGFKETVKVHPQRAKFFNEFVRNRSNVVEQIERAVHVPLHKKMFGLVKRGIRKMVKLF